MEAKRLIDNIKRLTKSEDENVFFDDENGNGFSDRVSFFRMSDNSLHIKLYRTGVTEESTEEEAKVDRKKAEEDELAHIKMIISIADRILETTDKKELLKMGERGYYERVLEQYEDVCKYPFSL